MQSNRITFNQLKSKPGKWCWHCSRRANTHKLWTRAHGEAGHFIVRGT